MMMMLMTARPPNPPPPVKYARRLKRLNWGEREGLSESYVLRVFSVTPFKIDQNENQNHSIDKVQNLGNERR